MVVIIVAVLHLIISILVFLSESVFLTKRKANLLAVIISFVVGVISLFLIANMDFHFSNYIITTLILIVANGLKYYGFKLLEKDNFSVLSKGLIIYIVIFSLYPAFHFLLIGVILS